jgi:hypothetical protein
MRWAAESGDWAESLRASGSTVELLPRLAPRSLRRVDQEHQLGQFTGLARDAAACALRCGERQTAIELLEEGRAVLWGQRLETLSDVTALRRARPDLAERFEQLRDRFDSGLADPPASGAVSLIDPRPSRASG